MPPSVIKIGLPANAKHEEITKAVNAKLTRQATSLLRKNQEIVLSTYIIQEMGDRMGHSQAVAKKAKKAKKS